jgi:hypothetical protein
VGKKCVRAMVAFLTKDWATVRARHRRCSPRRTLTTAPESCNDAAIAKRAARAADAVVRNARRA